MDIQKSADVKINNFISTRMTIDKALSNTVLCHEINVFIELFGKATVLKTGIFQRFF